MPGVAAVLFNFLSVPELLTFIDFPKKNVVFVLDSLTLINDLFQWWVQKLVAMLWKRRLHLRENNFVDEHLLQWSVSTIQL